MSRLAKIRAAIRQVANEKPLSEITQADVARVMGVPWTTVRRHVGGKAGFQALLAVEAASGPRSQPDTRTRILLAAAEVFAREGYAGANLDEIAFLALLQQTVRQQLTGRRSEAAAIFAAADLEAAFARWLRQQVPGRQTNPETTRLFFEFVNASRAPEVGEPLRAVVREVLATASGVVEELQGQGRLTAQVAPETVALYLQALLNGLALNWLLDPEQVCPAEAAPALAQLLLCGLLPREGV